MSSRGGGRRWTEADYAAHRAKMLPGAEALPPSPSSKQGGCQKFGAVPVDADGFHFDSKGEAARFQHLRALQAIGTISGLQPHVRYPLVVNGVLVCEYEADATYDLGTEKVVEDFKGMRNPAYILKRKLAAALGIRIREVRRPKDPAGWDEQMVEKGVKL